MNKTLTQKRLLKRHKRHAADADARVKTSEPDVRTPEQIKAAREASRPAAGGRQNQKGRTAADSTRSLARRVAGSAAKADA